MAKAAKKKAPKKRQKRTIDIDSNLSFEQALKVAVNTPKKKKNR